VSKSVEECRRVTSGTFSSSIVGPHPSPLLKEREQIPFSDQDSAFLEKNSAQKVTLSLSKSHLRHLLLKEREHIPFSKQDSAFLEKNSAQKVTLSLPKSHLRHLLLKERERVTFSK